MPDINARRTLQAFVDQYPNQKLAALGLGISETYLSDLLHKRRTCGPKMLTKLGLRQIVVAR